MYQLGPNMVHVFSCITFSLSSPYLSFYLIFFFLSWIKPYLDGDILPGKLLKIEQASEKSSSGNKEAREGLQDFSSDITPSAAILIFSNTVCVATLA